MNELKEWGAVALYALGCVIGLAMIAWMTIAVVSLAIGTGVTIGSWL